MCTNYRAAGAIFRIILYVCVSVIHLEQQSADIICSKGKGQKYQHLSRNLALSPSLLVRCDVIYRCTYTFWPQGVSVAKIIKYGNSVFISKHFIDYKDVEGKHCRVMK